LWEKDQIIDKMTITEAKTIAEAVSEFFIINFFPQLLLPAYKLPYRYHYWPVPTHPGSISKDL